MLSVAKLKAERRAYYCDALAAGLDDYYLGVGEAPGPWVGRGAEILGLAGEVVDTGGFEAILAGRDPASGTQLVEHPVQVLGYDATFCAPKSVSVLYGLGSPAVAAQVRAAHDAAVAAALAAYEDVACRARRGHAGATVAEADGFVGAAFHHRTSRSGDPHLHTHVVLAYPVPYGGRWTALDGRRCFPWAKPVGHLYEAQLRTELTRRLGVQWGPVRNGIADIAAVPTPALRAFSKRRAEIEEHLEAVGRSSPRAAQLAAYATRQPKDHHRRADELRADWWRQASELGVTGTALAGWTGRGRRVERPDPTDPAVRRLFERLGGPDGLTVRRSTLSPASGAGRGRRLRTKRRCARRGSPGQRLRGLQLRHRPARARPLRRRAAPAGRLGGAARGRWRPIHHAGTAGHRRGPAGHRRRPPP